MCSYVVRGLGYISEQAKAALFGLQRARRYHIIKGKVTSDILGSADLTTMQGPQRT